MFRPKTDTTTRATTAAYSSVQALRQTFPRRDLTSFFIGAGFCLVAVLTSASAGAALGLGSLVAALAFLILLVGWLLAPHVVVAFVIPYFAFIPAGKIFFSQWLGATKDAVALAAAGALLISLHMRRKHSSRTSLDTPLTVLIAAILGLYVVNVGGLISGGHHGLAWAQGGRLVAGPLILLAAGLTVTKSARTLNLAAASLVFTGCAVALYGIAQQFLGGFWLVSQGYTWNVQVRTLSGHLRSFGTLDEPFAYAAFLLLALATVLFWMRPTLLAGMCGGLITVGLAASYVRTAILVGVALLALWLVRAQRTTAGFFLLAATAGAALALLFASAGASETRSVRAGPEEYITLNGRTTAWKTIFDKPSQLPFGLGVGKVGTAAIRAKEGLVISTSQVTDSTIAPDSGYFATAADVGLVGLALLLALVTRVVILALRGTRQPGNAAWLTLAYLIVILLDAVTRASFTGFPTAWVGMLLVGLGVATVSTRTRERLTSVS